ncbi:haloacid dehalogenase superfamily, subfamily IA, variant 3 with third motif having DD or ED/beta-phosphoglucomutase family hydrolase [Nocardioides scoriae]|uniref:Beta-phosphoglucomutase n=1 Tax=Nocardioides scoriae TaxID=642780 RepID=A0A1H1V8A9_9ACTN|nr:beta-phosphoglucomutase family hydrolase [Nocardioides scoriae]SDS80636.1 haloacid dehalogenase superfamily, subfamily IA, variant 3 with third motif having DD or ED/beta-phosphoglucomutase family hydrolase [Nocardioides scoriae]
MPDHSTGHVDWTDHAAVLFDLDGVVTPTAEVHMRAWSEMFNEFLSSGDQGGGDRAEYTDADYFAHVDGKPRYDGVRDFLSSRGIDLPEGSSEDSADTLSVRGLGNRKNDAFNAVLERDGVEAYPGSVALLDHLRDLGLPLAVVSSSANAPAVLEAAGLSDRFATVVSGAVADELGLPGKPAPDTFVHAAEVLGTTPEHAVVLEDAVSGVRAGAAGHFALVIGVDRGAGAQVLTDAGADVVVPDLADLVPAATEGDAR